MEGGKKGERCLRHPAYNRLEAFPTTQTFPPSLPPSLYLRRTGTTWS
jgi:hypothetical protein